MSYRDDAVDLLANEILREENKKDSVSLAKTKTEPPLVISPEEVEEMAGGVEVSMPEIDETVVEEGGENNG